MVIGEAEKRYNAFWGNWRVGSSDYANTKRAQEEVEKEFESKRNQHPICLDCLFDCKRTKDYKKRGFGVFCKRFRQKEALTVNFT